MNKKLWYGLAAIGLLRICMVAGFLRGIPPLIHEGWKFHQGGDQIEYFAIARSLATLQPIAAQFYPVGFPLLLAPFILLLRPDSWIDLIMPIVIFHTALAIGCIFIVGYLAYKLAENAWVALCSAALWALHPYGLYAVLALHPQAATVQSSYVSHAMWFPMLSDPGGAFFLLLGLLLFYLPSKQEHYSYGAGIAIGIAMLMRMPNGIAAGILAGGYLIKKRYSALINFSWCVLLMLIPQGVYNFYAHKNIVDVGYAARREVKQVLFSANYLFSYGKALFEMSPRLALLFLMSGLIIAMSVVVCREKKRFEWVIVIIFILSYGVFYGTWWAFQYFPYRFLIPIVPLLIILGIDWCALVIELLKKNLFTAHRSSISIM